MGVWSVPASETPSNSAVKLPIIDVTDRVFVPISAEKELSHAWVGQIVEDRQGFLWFGTRDGLVRYNGYQVRRYNPGSAGANGVFIQECCRYSLFRDRSGRIWIGASDSVYRYDSEHEQFTTLPFPPNKLQGLVRGINQDRSGTMWLATSRGLTRYNPENGETARFVHNAGDPATLGSNFVRATLEAKNGTLWVATNTTLDRFDRQTGRVTQHFSLRSPLQKAYSTGNPYVRLLEDRQGTIWIASARDGLAFVNPQQKALTFVALATGRNIEPGAWAILEDRKGALWVGTEYGLIRLDSDRKQLVRYRNDLTDRDSLPADWVLALFEDNEDGIWVGTANAGVARFSADPPPFRRYRRPQGTSSSSRTDYVVFAYEDSHGVIWAGTKGAIDRIDLKTGHYDIQPIGENTEVGSIAEDRSGQIWIGTFDGSLFRSNPVTKSWVAYPHHAGAAGCANNEVRALLVDHKGTLWAGAGESLCSFDPASNQFRRYAIGAPPPAEIDALAEDASGIFWIGSRQAGLYRFDPATAKFTAFRHSAAADSLSDDGVTSVLVDRSGAIWAGTLRGLNRLDAQTRKFTTYLEGDGLPGNIINGIVEDARGGLWITTNYGLSHLNPQSRTVYNYYRSDGVFDDLTGAWKGRSGQMFFGSYSGLTVLSAELIQEKHFTPGVALTDFKISDQSVRIGADAPLKQSISVTKALRLSHDQNTFAFEFAALSYADPEHTRYRYRLERLEDRWNEVASTQNFARYPLIAPGEYVFHVEAWTPRGSWSEPGAEVQIVILPPWWSTWWFRLAVAVAFGVTALLSYRWRLHEVTGRLNLLFEERLAERTRIARDFHDTLLQSFQAALLNFHAVTYLLKDRPAAVKALEKVIDQARQAITEGRDAIQGLRSSKHEGSDFEAAITRFGQQLAANQSEPAPAEFQVNVEGASRRLTPFFANELYDIAIEALRNAFHHSHARRIEVEIRYGAREFRLRVRDNGKGIDPNVLEAGRVGHYGLTGMRERTKLAGGRLVFWSELDSGAELELTVPASLAYAKDSDSGPTTLAAKIRRIFS
ncbi:MAG TPA: two-component regulator propeller domain-containing protein [Terriglobales bacterium]|nr:two-component regulator propeller domain-containing protein [Terriglobales bacterium]